MTDFIFRIQPNIMLGTHIISRVGQSILDYGSKFMLLCDPVLRDVDLIDKVVDSLEEKQISLFVFDEIPSSATSEALEQALSLARGAYVLAQTVAQAEGVNNLRVQGNCPPPLSSSGSSSNNEHIPWWAYPFVFLAALFRGRRGSGITRGVFKDQP